MARAKLHAERVNIIKMVKVAGKWPFAPVVERNGRIIRDHVWVSGHEEHHHDGRYYLEWYEAGRRRWKPVAKFEDLLPEVRSKFIEQDARRSSPAGLETNILRRALVPRTGLDDWPESGCQTDIMRSSADLCLAAFDDGARPESG
jgi:hypothetical protein